MGRFAPDPTQIGTANVEHFRSATAVTAGIQAQVVLKWPVLQRI